ncbi:hypothetical protein AB0L40_00110 [Patulibacter sp. NPDC049589]|uniref:hypothetical protein n=1 Tax=Patulibacter sp. NPDC049589 TaxID=3154731 RepID=UPI00343B717F
MPTDEAAMSESGREGRDPTPRDGTTKTADALSADAVALLLRAHGGDYARLLRQRRPGSRASGSGWRYYADATATAAGDDAEVHQILIDISVAAQHLSTNDALRTYASSKRRRVSGPMATAFLDGVIDRVDRFPHDVLRPDG